MKWKFELHGIKQIANVILINRILGTSIKKWVISESHDENNNFNLTIMDLTILIYTCAWIFFIKVTFITFSNLWKITFHSAYLISEPGSFRLNYVLI